MDPRDADDGGADAARPLYLVTTRPDSEIAADLKARIDEAAQPLLELMDEALAAGFVVQFDGIGIQAPYFKNRIINPRVVKVY